MIAYDFILYKYLFKDGIPYICRLINHGLKEDKHPIT